MFCVAVDEGRRSIILVLFSWCWVEPVSGLRATCATNAALLHAHLVSRQGRKDNAKTDAMTADAWMYR
ncbi:MAG TPA: hypothetical protein VF258_04195 [Luteolibacter sp.]